MIKAEQIPREVREAFYKACWEDDLSDAQAIAAALNAWPGMDTRPNIYGRQDAILTLPLTQENSDEPK